MLGGKLPTTLTERIKTNNNYPNRIITILFFLTTYNLIILALLILLAIPTRNPSSKLVVHSSFWALWLLLLADPQYLLYHFRAHQATPCPQGCMLFSIQTTPPNRFHQDATRPLNQYHLLWPRRRRNPYCCKEGQRCNDRLVFHC